MLDDTVVAIATPPGRGGIGVLRLSGSRAVEIASTVTRARITEPNRAVVTDLVDGDTVIDHVVVTTFRAPHSYTGEDTVEISCHGAPIVLGTALDTLLRAGCRLATPGEFTLRAFVNGRIDLTQAEAVRDLVDAQTSWQARRAQRQLRGELSTRLAPLTERLLELIVHLESTVEFVEDEIEPASRAALTEELERAARELAELASSYRVGRLVTEGVGVAIVGPPNAGKSSVFNRLVESERAIVTEVPGTTRDLVSERVVVGGIPFRLVDTAGLRDTEDRVESIGIERTRGAIADADVVLVVVDVSDADAVDSLVPLLAATEGLRRIVVLNKTDLASPSPELALLAGDSAVAMSALTGEGIDALRDSLLELSGAGTGLTDDTLMVTNARHHALLSAAAAHLAESSGALLDGLSEEIALVGLHGALRDLGELTGETAIDDILNRIFSTFCIGK